MYVICRGCLGARIWPLTIRLMRFHFLVLDLITLTALDPRLIEATKKYHDILLCRRQEQLQAAEPPTAVPADSSHPDNPPCPVQPGVDTRSAGADASKTPGPLAKMLSSTSSRQIVAESMPKRPRLEQCEDKTNSWADVAKTLSPPITIESRGVDSPLQPMGASTPKAISTEGLRPEVEDEDVDMASPRYLNGN